MKKNGLVLLVGLIALLTIVLFLLQQTPDKTVPINDSQLIKNDAAKQVSENETGVAQPQNKSEEKTEPEDVFPYGLDALFVAFNGKSRDDITANSSNTEFQEYFSNELKKISSEIPQVKDMRVRFWYTEDVAFIDIFYTYNVSNSQKNHTLHLLKSKFWSKWYTRDVQYTTEKDFNYNSAYIIHEQIKIEPQIMKELETKEKVRVYIFLNKPLNRTFEQTLKDILSQLGPDFKLAFEFPDDHFSGIITQKGIDKLKIRSEISYIDVILPGTFTSLPKNIELIKANAAWTFNPTLNGEGQTICLLDSGINYEHPELGGCIGENCKVISGHNFCADTECTFGNENVTDLYGHGTFMGGILVGDNKVKGIAPKAKLIVYKIAYNSTPNDDAVEKAILQCIANSSKFNISAISMSFSLIGNDSVDNCEPTTGLSKAILNASNNSIFVAVASGNNNYTNSIRYPACTKGATSVGSSTDDDEMWNGFVANNVVYGTNRYKNLDLLAPGVLVQSTATQSSAYSSSPFCISLYSGYGFCSGTSEAVPQVAGAAVLLRQAYGTLSPMQIEGLLRETGVPVYDSASGFSYPRIDVEAALQAAWPTENHDFHRTGFTVLRGDIADEGDVERSDFVLQANLSNVSEDAVLRPSVGDVDGNGDVDVVTAIHEKYSSAANNVFVTETLTWRYGLPPEYLFGSPFNVREKWGVGVYSSVMSPPTLENIDSDVYKEVIVAVRNSTLIAYDGLSGIEEWRYTGFDNKYSAYTGYSYQPDVGGVAVADVDRDGDKEIILTDWRSPLIYDLDGELYIFSKDGDLRWNVTFGNGGSYGVPSVADFEGDGYPEIVVPSYYGVFVYHYDAALGRIVNVWNNSNGLIEESVLIYDVDFDNEYELIYVTSDDSRCSSFKSCDSYLRIVDAKTKAVEHDIAVPLSYISKVTPSVANLDGDPNSEIIISVRYAEGSDRGEIICYDAVTEAEDCNTNRYFLAFKTSWVSPSVADINGDGKYEIIYGENNGSQVYVFNGSGAELFTYNFYGFIDNAIAVADLDNDGKAEIVLKKAGSPISVLSIMSNYNDAPMLGSISNITAVVGDLVNINESGEVLAFDSNSDQLNFSFGFPFNSSGLWQTTAGDVGNYSVLVEVSDGNLSDYQYVDLYVFNATKTRLVSGFSDGSSSALLNFTQAGNKTVYVRLPKNATIVYSHLRIGGLAP